MFQIILVFSVVLCVCARNEEYMGYKVYNIKLETDAQTEKLHELKGDVIDFWRQPSLKNNVVGKAMVPPSQIDWFEERLAKLNVAKDIFIKDLYDHLTIAETSLKRTFDRNEERQFDYDGYYRYDEILTYLQNLEQSFVNSTTTTFTIEEYGRTDNDRSLFYIKLSNNVNTETVEEEKPVVVIEAGIVPREWITIPAALKIIDEVLNATEYLDKADWIIVPVVNPDGYEYSHSNLRVWTKNLSTRSNLGFICPGVNINRNFDIDWQGSDSSTSPCSHLYAGVDAFSEPESQMIRSIINTYSERIKMYVSLQNSGGFISYPWQYERAASGMFRQHFFLAMDMVAAMNDEYFLDVGWSALGDRAAGTGSDFAQQSGVLYSMNIDVVPKGDDGVNIPEEEIGNVVEDVWRAVSVAANTVI